MDDTEPATPQAKTFPRPHWMMRRRRWLRPIISRRGTPEAIALGLAIGFFIAFSPTMGVQIILAYFVATMLKANRAAAIVPVWITMPATVPPIYAFTYWVGTFFVDGPSVSVVRTELVQAVRNMGRHSLYDLPSHLQEFGKIGGEIFIPMLIGGAIVGGLCSAIAYPTALWSIRRYRAHRDLVRQRRVEGRRGLLRARRHHQ